MSNRIIIGKNPIDSRCGVWISPPGESAGDIKNKHVFSSDNDYLKLHTQGGMKLTAEKTGMEYPYSWDYMGEASFPNLGYYPFFLFCAYKSDEILGFPQSIQSNDYMPYILPFIGKNKIYFRSAPWSGNQDIYVKWVIFKNRLM